MDFPDTGIRNGFECCSFGARTSIDFQDFSMKFKVGYTFSTN